MEGGQGRTGWRRTGFSFAVEGGEGGEGADEDAEVGDGDEEGKPIHCFYFVWKGGLFANREMGLGRCWPNCGWLMCQMRL